MNDTKECFNDSLNAIIRHNGDLGFYNHFTIKYKLEIIFVPLWFILGLPGNLISIYIWSRFSVHYMVSSLYLAVLAVVDGLFFFRHLIWHLQSIYKANTIKNPVMCHLFPVINMILQFSPPLLILGFTIERFISVCYPLYRRKICTVERTKHVIFGILFICVVLALPQAYFFHYIEHDASVGDCEDLENYLKHQYKDASHSISSQVPVYHDWRYRFLYIYNLLSESFFFIFIPFIILTFNVVVIGKLNQVHRFRRTLTRNHLRKREDRQISATISLLSVSFFIIFTSLPASIFQMIKFNENSGDICLSDDNIRKNQIWISHFHIINIQTQIEMLSISHYAANFYIYILTCKQFRKQFCSIFFRTGNVQRCNHFSQQSNMSRLTFKPQ